ncbi:MAG: hypothetical protein ACYCOR_16455 [Acidobacteriaceae bacterium]
MSAFTPEKMVSHMAEKRPTTPAPAPGGGILTDLNSFVAATGFVPLG